MFRKSLMPRTGMLFVFPEEGPLVFWMKNTWIDLDILFLNKKKKIQRIFPRVPRSYPELPEEKVAKVLSRGSYVLELPSGTAFRHGLRKEQTLSFKIP